MTTATQTERQTRLVGWYDEGQFRRRVEIEFEIRPGKRGDELAITSTAGRAIKRTGEFRMERWQGEETGDPIDASGGQDRDSVAAVTMFAPGWDAAKRDKLLRVWDRWHLNGMNAGCEHQRAEGWDERPIDPSKPLRAYGTHFEGQRSASWNMLAWVRPDEHPDGLLTKPCDVCGYRYGSAWLFEPLPAEVVEFIESL